MAALTKSFIRGYLPSSGLRLPFGPLTRLIAPRPVPQDRAPGGQESPAEQRNPGEGDAAGVREGLLGDGLPDDYVVAVFIVVLTVVSVLVRSGAVVATGIVVPIVEGLASPPITVGVEDVRITAVSLEGRLRLRLAIEVVAIQIILGKGR